MEDRISRQLQHCSKVCCEKGSCRGRQALIVDKKCTVEICFPDEWTWHMTVISNQGLEFVSNFLHLLGIALDMWLHFTSGYHPEDDKQTQHMN